MTAIRRFRQHAYGRLQPVLITIKQFLHQSGIEHGAAAIAVLVTILASGLALTAQTRHSFRVFANEKHLVQVYVDGKQRNVVSSADTVRDVLSENGVDIKDGDVVEPAVDASIDQPNFNINVYRALPAVVVDGSKTTQVVTGYRSARKIAAAANVTLYPEDKAEVQQVQDFQPSKTLGFKVVITRAKAVQLVINGQVLSLRTHASTVGALLKEKNIDYQATDLQGVADDTQITNGLRVVLSKTSQETVTVVEDVAPSVQVSYDANMAAGSEKVTREGTPGRKQVIYLIERVNGQETKRSALEETILTAAVSRILVRGSMRVAGQPTPEQWAKLRFCEAGGDYAKNTNNGYYGAYQMNVSFWKSYGDNPNILASQASPASQDAAALKAYAKRGSNPWPVCGRFLN